MIDVKDFFNHKEIVIKGALCKGLFGLPNSDKSFFILSQAAARTLKVQLMLKYLPSIFNDKLSQI